MFAQTSCPKITSIQKLLPFEIAAEISAGKLSVEKDAKLATQVSELFKSLEIPRFEKKQAISYRYCLYIRCEK